MKEFMEKNKVKYLHIFTYTLFIEPYVNFINKNFDSKEHLFLILTNTGKVNLRENVKKVSRNFKSLLLLIREIYKCEKIFLHGLVHYEIVLIFFLQPWLLRKCNWVVFGVDLYQYKFRKKSFKSNLYEVARRLVIKNTSGIVAFIKGDYKLAQKWYGVKGKHYYSFLYPNVIYKELDLPKVRRDNEKIYIQVGNAADPALNHLEVFNQLEKHKDKAIEIICPLAYGDEDYRNKVIKEGTKIFGNKFNPIIELVSFEKYSELLAKVDIAIFNFKGQQAGYNILILIGLGKKVYIRNDVTFWQLCSDFGLKVYSYNDLDRLFEKIPNDIKLNNIDIIKNHFTEKKLKEDWEKIFQNKE
jgi:RNAse (barnase) inhibitor barstar